MAWGRRWAGRLAGRRVGGVSWKRRLGEWKDQTNTPSTWRGAAGESSGPVSRVPDGLYLLPCACPVARSLPCCLLPPDAPQAEAPSMQKKNESSNAAESSTLAWLCSHPHRLPRPAPPQCKTKQQKTIQTSRDPAHLPTRQTAETMRPAELCSPPPAKRQRGAADSEPAGFDLTAPSPARQSAAMALAFLTNSTQMPTPAPGADASAPGVVAAPADSARATESHRRGTMVAGVKSLRSSGSTSSGTGETDHASPLSTASPSLTSAIRLLATTAAATAAAAAPAAVSTDHSVSPPPLPSAVPAEAKPSRTGPSSGSYSRRDKSLGVLCSNFVHLFETKDPEAHQTLCLDDAAMRLNVERRRIYDIVNILESIDYVRRQCKNTYLWQGNRRLRECLKRLQDEAVVLWPGDARRFALLATDSSDPSVTEAGAAPPASDRKSVV